MSKWYFVASSASYVRVFLPSSLVLFVCACVLFGALLCGERTSVNHRSSQSFTTKQWVTLHTRRYGSPRTIIFAKQIVDGKRELCWCGFANIKWFTVLQQKADEKKNAMTMKHRERIKEQEMRLQVFWVHHKYCAFSPSLSFSSCVFFLLLLLNFSETKAPGQMNSSVNRWKTSAHFVLQVFCCQQSFRWVDRSLLHESLSYKLLTVLSEKREWNFETLWVKCVSYLHCCSNDKKWMVASPVGRNEWIMN